MSSFPILSLSVSYVLRAYYPEKERLVRLKGAKIVIAALTGVNCT
jgi:hypothetical protein